MSEREAYIVAKIKELEDEAKGFKSSCNLYKYLELKAKIRAWKMPNLCPDYVHDSDNMCLTQSDLIGCIRSHNQYGCPNRGNVDWSMEEEEDE